jgi:hypothetical protein
MTLAPLAAQAAASPGEGGPGDTAVAYANALALNNTQRAWQLLSTKSRNETDVVQWQTAYEQRQPVMKPPATTVLRALAGAAEAPVVTDVLVNPGEAFLEVKGTVQVTQHVMVVKESGVWRVDLMATDSLNSKEAGQLFLEAVRDEALSGQARASRPPAGIPLLRAMMAPQAKNYRVLQVDGDQNQADVVVTADLPVNLVLRASRSGPGWTVDFSRPLAQVDLSAAEPLKEAAAQATRQACEEQLRQISSAIQLYAAASDDMLPDPSRWLDQIAMYLPQPAKLHCPGDPKGGVSYAMNRNLAGKRRRDIANPAMVPLVHESTLHARNAADTGQSWPGSAWHVGGNLVLYLDGSVRLTAAKPSFDAPKAPPGSASSLPARPTPQQGGGPGPIRPQRPPRPGAQPRPGVTPGAP